jgi:hypothetical protein
MAAGSAHEAGTVNCALDEEGELVRMADTMTLC